MDEINNMSKELLKMKVKEAMKKVAFTYFCEEKIKNEKE